MPDNAVVLLDDQTRTYFSPACAEREKREYRQTTAAEARKLNYARIKTAGMRRDSGKIPVP